MARRSWSTNVATLATLLDGIFDANREANGIDERTDQTGETPEANENVPELMNRSVLRAMALLQELGKRPEGATAAELAVATRLARPTAFRLLLSLAHSGMVVKIESRFSLGLELARLGRIADPYRELQPRVQVFIDRLSKELNEATAFSIVTGPSGLDLIAEAAGSHLLSTAMGYIGRDMPLHASAMGKILLAELADDQIVALLPEQLEKLTPFTITDRRLLLHELADVRARGYATLDNELEDGLYAVAVPVRDHAGHLTGILSVSGLGQRMKAVNVHAYIEKLRTASNQLTADILGS
ncbi:IclR family transcriptional regulator [Cryobacterium melibiosiphilum]|uniref:IclR family transcriptional regulator n=1 Tax=Cryobacterium melibiosiphilum TaxID=995039 RepID=UPI0013147BD4|nr:IclR family transcriptional regulator [Cryobacterium melibiosiphilum]